MAVNGGQYKTTYQTALTDVKENDVEGIGCLRLQDGKVYRWVLFSTGTATLASVVGGLLGFLATDKALTTVCTDYSDCVATFLAGQALVAGMTTGYYCWIQVGGIGASLTNDITSVAVGNTCGLSGDDQGLILAADTSHVGGVCVDATTTAQKLWLTCIK